MLRANPDSTTSMPRWLLLVAAALVIFRIVAEAMPARHEPDLVAWRDPSSVEAIAATTGSTPVLYYYSASWCQPCRRLDKDVFHDADMAEYVNARFVPFIAPRDFRPALGTSLGEMEFLFMAGALLFHHLHHGGNDLAGLLDDDRVTLTDVFALDLLIVVQRGTRDGGPGNEDRLQFRHRCEHS